MVNDPRSSCNQLPMRFSRYHHLHPHTSETAHSSTQTFPPPNPQTLEIALPISCQNHQIPSKSPQSAPMAPRRRSVTPSPFVSRRITRRCTALFEEGIPEFKPSDLANLCDGLFDKLQEQLADVLSGAVFTDCVAASPQGFLQLLRSCLVLLEFTLQIPELKSLCVKKCVVLIDVMRELCPPHLSAGDGADLEGGAPAWFLATILEVFIHELSMRRLIRKNLAETDYGSATTGTLFVPQWSYGHMNTVLELVSSHFILSIHDELACREFMSSLYWSAKDGNKIPEVGLSAAMTLLGDPFMFSAPNMLQAHLILLTSRCIGIHMPTCDTRSNAVALHHLLAAFELSVKLYGVYMPRSEFLDKFVGSESRSRCDTEVPFDLCIRQVTCDELNHRTSKLVHFCHAHSHGVLSEIKEEIMNASGNYITENQHVVDAMIQDESCLILNYIILKVLPGESEKSTVQENGEQTHQEVYCLAAAMKLMGSSLLQILWHLKREGFVVTQNTLEDQPFSDEYNFLSGTISSFAKYGTSQTIQEALLPVMETQHRFKKTVLILAHFASLLSYSIKKRVDFLWRGCIFMMMVIMNIFHLEDGNLDAFRPLLSNVEYISAPRNCMVNTPEVHVPRRSSAIIASRIQKIRKLLPKEQDKFLTYDKQLTNRDGHKEIEKAIATQDEGFDTLCNGVPFLKAVIPGFEKKASEYADLVDFIVCTEGKDYDAYLKNRSQFYQWGQERKVGKRKSTVKEFFRQDTLQLPSGARRLKKMVKQVQGKKKIRTTKKR